MANLPQTTNPGSLVLIIASLYLALGVPTKASALPELAIEGGAELTKKLESLYQQSGQKDDLFLIARDGQNMSRLPWLNPDYELTDDVSPRLKQPTLFQWLKGSNPFLKKEGPKFSHVGIVARSHPGIPDENWGFRHLLRDSKNPGFSKIYDQTTAEFFADDPASYRYAILVPTQEMQAKIRQFIFNESNIELIHNPAYNSLAYPFVNESHPKNLDMNSNQFILNAVVAAALPEELEPELLAGKVDFVQRQIWNLGFVPDHMWVGVGSNIGGTYLKTLGFALIRQTDTANLGTIPQSDSRRQYRNNVAPVTTFDSMVQFFDEQGWIQADVGKNGYIFVDDFRN